MSQISTNDFRAGVKLIYDGAPCSIVENEFVKPGKGQAFNRVKLRNLLTDRLLEKTFKSNESFELADVLEREMQYLYQEDGFWIFMDQETFDQVSVSTQALSKAKDWIQEEDICSITLFNGKAISVLPPNFVELEIIDTDPGLRGDTSSAGSKPATVSTGAIINKIPLFVQIGDVIKIDTREGTYSGRVS